MPEKDAKTENICEVIMMRQVKNDHTKSACPQNVTYAFIPYQKRNCVL